MNDSRSDTTVPLADWRVMIVEDNSTVAAVHKRIVDSVPYLHTEHIASNGTRALEAMRTVQPDLVILDLTMAGGDGLPFLRKLRREGIPVDVIVVTASRGGRIVQECMHLGAVDYLVKPFSPHRLRAALTATAMRWRTLARSDQLSQADVDTVQASGSAGLERRLPTGLKDTTLDAVIAVLEADYSPFSANEVAERVGVARVTARRYLEYLQVLGIVEMSREGEGPGRPRNRYRLRRMPA
ncbi:MAG: two-component system, CitB family, response regulator DctR [Thermoleophilaceae bacterium]|jgi:two-component system response regulator DctR|nr:two-component system, CitB family, response regulator DctR [Thermoleophilaceae bacterium]MEA2406027.1 two-component system, CitB family, response regulator DctR [Thermoleophilaceae bacterium]